MWREDQLRLRYSWSLDTFKILGYSWICLQHQLYFANLLLLSDFTCYHPQGKFPERAWHPLCWWKLTNKTAVLPFWYGGEIWLDFLEKRNSIEERPKKRDGFNISQRQLLPCDHLGGAVLRTERQWSVGCKLTVLEKHISLANPQGLLGLSLWFSLPNLDFLSFILGKRCFWIISS